MNVNNLPESLRTNEKEKREKQAKLELRMYIVRVLKVILWYDFKEKFLYENRRKKRTDEVNKCKKKLYDYVNLNQNLPVWHSSTDYQNILGYLNNF